MTFTIDCDNNITAFGSLKEAQAADIAGAEYFDSQKELAQLAASWPVAGARGKSKLIELWNNLPASPRSRSSRTARRPWPESGRPPKP